MNHRQFFGAAILQKVHSGLIADISVWVQSSGQGYEVKINIVDHEMDSKALVNLILIWIFQIRLQPAFQIWWSLNTLNSSVFWLMSLFNIQTKRRMVIKGNLKDNEKSQ